MTPKPFAFHLPFHSLHYFTSFTSRFPTTHPRSPSFLHLFHTRSIPLSPDDTPSFAFIPSPSSLSAHPSLSQRHALHSLHCFTFFTPGRSLPLPTTHSSFIFIPSPFFTPVRSLSLPTTHPSFAFIHSFIHSFLSSPRGRDRPGVEKVKE